MRGTRVRRNGRFSLISSGVGNKVGWMGWSKGKGSKKEWGKAAVAGVRSGRVDREKRKKQSKAKQSPAQKTTRRRLRPKQQRQTPLD